MGQIANEIREARRAALLARRAADECLIAAIFGPQLESDFGQRSETGLKQPPADLHPRGLAAWTKPHLLRSKQAPRLPAPLSRRAG
jgi:hypothetical protein